MTVEKIDMIGDGDKLCILGICTLTSVNNKAYASHLEWAYKLAKNNPEWRFSLWTPYRMSIANFRNYLAKIALKTDSDRLLFIDDDAVLTKHMDLFERLLKRDKHIIMPIVYVRGYPFRPMIFKWVDKK